MAEKLSEKVAQVQALWEPTMQTKLLEASDQLKKRAVLLLVLAVFFVLVARAWPNTWDDSGITLAFSRNLARYGDIFPTPLNGRVEGYSSFLWMALNALFFRLGLQENSVVTLAKIISTGFALINILLFWKLITANLRTPVYRVTALTLFAINTYTIASAIDGMETSLYAFLVLLTYFLYKRYKTNRAFYLFFTISGALLILVRHEGVLFLAPFVGEMLIRHRKDFLKEPFLYFWAFVFLTYHLWHYLFFGELLTNPMLAKRYWPYRPDFENWTAFISYYFIPVFDFFFRYIILFICLPIYYFLRKKPKTGSETRENWTLINLIVLVSVFLMLITGANWGAAARLSYPGLVFLLLLLFSKIDDAELFAQSKVLQIGLAFGLLINFVILFESVSQTTPDLITLAGVERRASVLVAAKIALGHPEITFAGADMGGLLLYHSDGLKIVDLGLLCDKELAQNGYAHYDEYVFEQSRPEIIGAVGFWLIPLRQAAEFTRSYFPVMVITGRDKQIFYMRKDVIAELKNRYTMPGVIVKPVSTDDIGQQTLAEFGGYSILDLRQH